MITLQEALKSGRLSDFIDQEEARGVGPIDRAAFDDLLRKAATKEQRSKDRTSRSSSGDGSNGTETRQGKPKDARG